MAQDKGTTYTTEALIEILAKEQAACIRGDRLNLAAQASGHPSLDRLIDPTGIQKFTAYQNFRAAVHRYQIEQNVSGVVWRNLTLGQESLRFPTVHEQLLALPADLRLLRSHRGDVLEFWRRTSQDLCAYLSLGQGRAYREVTAADQARLCDRAEWAIVSKLDRADGLELILQLGWGNPTEARDRSGWPASGSEWLHAVPRGCEPIG